MSETLVAGGFSDDEWDDEDEQECEWWLRKLALWRGFFGPMGAWRLFDQYAPIVIALRVEAKQVAQEKDLELGAVWHVTRKRAFQMIEEIIDQTRPFRLSNHHSRIIRGAYSKASVDHPTDFDARRELAHDLLMEHGDSRTEDAWDAYHMGQQSLFEVVGYEQVGFELRPTELHETVPDPTTTGRDPGERTFLDHVLDDADAPVTLRQRVISQLISEGDSYQQICDNLGLKSKGTVASDVAALREVHEFWLNGLAGISRFGDLEESDDEAEADDERHLHPID